MKYQIGSNFFVFVTIAIIIVLSVIIYFNKKASDSKD